MRSGSNGKIQDFINICHLGHVMKMFLCFISCEGAWDCCLRDAPSPPAKYALKCRNLLKVST